MRIISAIVAAAIIFLAILIPNAKASDTIDTDTKTKETISLINSFLKRNIAFAAEESAPSEQESVDQASQEQVQPEVPKDERLDVVLAHWKGKQGALWENLPKEKFTINASAYTAAADECGKSDGITASGVKVQEKRTIACPKNFPFGTKMEIENMGTYVCEDRGGAIKGNKIDIYVETKAEAFQFGRRNLIAQIID